MDIKSLKSALKFWQEIVFIVPLGILVTWSIINVFWNDIYFHIYIVFLLLFICLIGQFFWKNISLAMMLAAVLGLGSIYMMIGWFAEIIKDLDIWAVLSFVFFVGLSFAAITMPIKYVKMIIEK